MSASQQVKLRKAARVVGNTLSFRNADVADAAFILSLRTGREKSRDISAVSCDFVDQQALLSRHVEADDQVYFIIEYKGDPIGTVRLYDPQGDSFCWGRGSGQHTSQPGCDGGHADGPRLRH